MVRILFALFFFRFFCFDIAIHLKAKAKNPMRFLTVGCEFRFGFSNTLWPHYNVFILITFLFLQIILFMIRLTKKQNNSANGLKPKKIFADLNDFFVCFWNLLYFWNSFRCGYKSSSFSIFKPFQPHHWCFHFDNSFVVRTFLRDCFNAINIVGSHHSPYRLFGSVKVNKMKICCETQSNSSCMNDKFP